MTRFPYMGQRGPAYRDLLLLRAFHKDPDREMSPIDMYDAIYGPSPSLAPLYKRHQVERVFRRLVSRGFIRRLPMRRPLHRSCNQRTSMESVYVVELSGLDYYLKNRYLLRTRR